MRLLEDKSADGSVRCEVARALGELGDARACDVLVRTLPESSYLEIACADALIALNDPRGYDGLLCLLENERLGSWVRRIWANALLALDTFPWRSRKGIMWVLENDGFDDLKAILEHAQAPQVFKAMLRNEDVDNLQLACPNDVNGFGDPRAYDVFMRLLKIYGEHDSVRYYCAKAFAAIGGQVGCDRLNRLLKLGRRRDAVQAGLNEIQTRDGWRLLLNGALESP